MVHKKIINVAIVHSNELLVEGMGSIFANEEMYHLVAVEKSSEPLIWHHKQKIDILFIDVNVYAAEETLIPHLKEQFAPKIVLLSERKAHFAAHEAAIAGIQGYILEDMNIQTFKEAIQQVMKGYNYYHPLIANELYKNLQDVNRITVTRGKDHPFTKRELQILQLMGEGKSNLNISEKVNISERTIRNHVASIFKKLNVKNRTKAIIICSQKGWINIGK